MPDEPEQLVHRGLFRRVFAGLWWFCCHRLTRYVAAWLVALGVASLSLEDAYFCFDDAHRADGTYGHTTIDFGGQWVMGRMLVDGHGRHLYQREYQRRLVRQHFPPEDENPNRPTNDADQLMGWFMGEDDPRTAESIGTIVLLSGALPRDNPIVLQSLLSQAVLHELWRPQPVYQASGAIAPLAAAEPLGIAPLALQAQQAWPENRARQVIDSGVGGPLYPPINSLYFYPLGLMPPRIAYRVNQIANLLLAFLAGLGLRQLAQGRVWWPVAAVLVIIYPGFTGSIALGQNAALTLAILVWGWVLIARGRPGWGGVIWGLLAFKPVWALAVLLVPVVTRRWRVCLTMAATGFVLFLATLPTAYRPRQANEPLGEWALGPVQPWRDWLKVGREATRVYNVNENWVFLSRDLLSIPRRWMYSFQEGDYARDPNWLPPALVGVALVVFVLEVTVRLAALRRVQAQALIGPPAAFLFLAAWMTCFHFMYYDMLLSVLPVFLLLAEPRRFLQPRLLAIRPLSETQLGAELFSYYRPRIGAGPLPPVPRLAAGHGHVWVLNSFTLTLVAVLLLIERVFRTMGIQVSASGAFLDNWPLFSSLSLKQPLLFSIDWKGTPTETFCLFVLWLSCGWQWLRTPAEAPRLESSRAGSGRVEANGPVHAAEFVQLGPDVGRAH